MRRKDFMCKLTAFICILLMLGNSITVYAQEDSGSTNSVSDNTPDQSETETTVTESEEETEEESETSTSEEQTQAEETTAETESASENTTESEENVEESVIPDGSFYYLQGTVQNGGNCFISDITIYPTGVDGFCYIKKSEEEKFSECIVISQDAENGVISVQFSDGERVTEPMELTYSKDTQCPLLEEVSSEKETVIENVILLTTPVLYVNARDIEEVSEDGNRISGSGIEAVYCKYDGAEYRYELEEGMATVTLPESFYGNVEIWCKDYAGNGSQVYSAVYLTDVTKPQVNISTNAVNTELMNDEILVEIMDAGVFETGITSVLCTLNGAELEPELTVTPQEVTINEEGQEVESATIYSFVLQITEETSDLSLQVTDGAGNVETCSYRITKEAKPEAYQMELPNHLDIVLDPFQLMSDKQIISEGNIVKNLNDFPVKISIVQFEYVLNRGNFAEYEQPCELRLSLEGMEPVIIEEGTTEKVAEFILEPQEQMDICFDGSIALGSENLWRAGDISVKFVCEFEKVRNLIVEKMEKGEE